MGDIAGEATPLPGALIAHTAGCPSGAITEATVSAQRAGEEGPSGAAGKVPLALWHSDRMLRSFFSTEKLYIHVMVSLYKNDDTILASYLSMYIVLSYRLLYMMFFYN